MVQGGMIEVGSGNLDAAQIKVGEGDASKVEDGEGIGRGDFLLGVWVVLRGSDEGKQAFLEGEFGMDLIG